MQPDVSNIIFQLALDLVNYTAQHIFLTGKAGTGKTTFLRYIKEHTKKNTAIVAPTGVAAINAGGVTMHSLFQLPFGVFVPGSLNRDEVTGAIEVIDRHGLFRNMRFSAEKREMLQELELLIIDEVSMLRCDMLDAIDAILRHFRRAPLVPFGGVQMLYIGDLFQLPPVVSNDEWAILQHYHQTPFFFSAKALAEMPPVYIELKKIYRQNEQQFIDVLNRIRNNQLQKDDFTLLDSKYDPHFVPDKEDQFITLTTHNKKADTLNGAALAKLPGQSHSFKAEIKNDFSDKAFPTDVELRLKEGAQVMFIKNDSGGERRYFNGKLAVIKSIKKEEVLVSFVDGSPDLKLEKETWKNIRYNYNKEEDRIDEEELGSFTQFPVRLAWAITVHKSQGLTFEKAIIDAGSAFAAGQVYVALSRCTSLSGLVLQSRINSYSISTDKRIIEFAQREAEEDKLKLLLKNEKYKYLSNALIKIFDWTKILATLRQWMEEIPGKKLPEVKEALALAQSVFVYAKEMAEVAVKFQRQLQQLLTEAQETGNVTAMRQRVNKAIDYFAKAIAEGILQPIQKHIDSLRYVSKVRKYLAELAVLEGFMWQQMQKLLQAQWGDLPLALDKSMYQFLDPSKKAISTKQQTVKGSSQRISFELFRNGNSIADIARLRLMAASTIEGHLAGFIRTGEIEVTELVPVEKVECIHKVVEELGIESAGLIKSKLGDDFTYNEIRAVINDHLWRSRANVSA